MNCSKISAMETSEFARAVVVLEFKEEENDEFDRCRLSDVKMTRFGYRVDLISERHVRVKEEAKIASRGTDWDDIIAER